MNRIVGQASSLLVSRRLEARPTTKPVHGPNVHPILEVAAPPEPALGVRPSRAQRRETAESVRKNPVACHFGRCCARGRAHSGRVLAIRRRRRKFMVPMCIRFWRPPLPMNLPCSPKDLGKTKIEKNAAKGSWAVGRSEWNRELSMNPGGADLPVSRGAEAAVGPCTRIMSASFGWPRRPGRAALPCCSAHSRDKLKLELQHRGTS